MIEWIVFTLLWISNLFFILKWRIERDAHGKTYDRYYYLVLRGEELYTWCNAEFPQIGYAALHIVAYDARQAHTKQAIDGTHKCSTDQFRDYMRRWFKQ